MKKEENSSKIVEKICKKTNKSKKEVKELIEEKKSKFSGLLTDSGAAFMIAKELGVKVGVQKNPEKKIKINNLEEGMKNIDLLVRVLHVYSPKTYEKKQRKGRYCRLLVGDETGEISLTLWEKNTKKMEKQKVERGSVLLLKNAYVNSYKGQLQLGLSSNGKIVISPKADTSTLPKPESIALKLADLDEGMENIDVFARVIRVFEVNEFKREGEKRKVVNFLIGDGTDQIRATAWNNLAEIVNRLEAGELIKIEGGYTKKGLKGTELHLGWNARIIREPTIGFKIPELKELSKTEIERKKIKNLKKGENVEVMGTIVSIQKGNLLFNVCPKCGGKLNIEKKGFNCEKCGKIKKPKKKTVVSITIDDGSNAIRASLFGRNAEKVLEKTTSEIIKALEEKEAMEIINQTSNKVVGKNYLFTGRVKENALNPEELELSVFTVRKIKIEKETEKIMTRV